MWKDGILQVGLLGRTPSKAKEGLPFEECDERVTSPLHLLTTGLTELSTSPPRLLGRSRCDRGPGLKQRTALTDRSDYYLGTQYLGTQSGAKGCVHVLRILSNCEPLSITQSVRASPMCFRQDLSQRCHATSRRSLASLHEPRLARPA